MTEDLIALAGDLVYERKRVSEGLRRIEGSLWRSEGLREELDQITRGLDRIGALARTLAHRLCSDRLSPCEPLLESARDLVEREAARLGMQVTVDCRGGDIKLDRALIEEFRPVLSAMLATFIEFCLESPRERTARGKRPRAHVQIEMTALEEGHRLMVVCDGNGIPPPRIDEHGRMLAAIGARAAFDGKAGQWAAWRFHLPVAIGACRCVPIRSGAHSFCVPAAALGGKTAAGGAPAVRLDARMDRVAVKPGEEAASGSHLVEVHAGTGRVLLAVDEIGSADDFFVRPLEESLRAGGRYLGAVVTGGGDAGELRLILDPGYIVYGAP